MIAGWLPITAERIQEIMAAIRPHASELDRAPRAGCVEGAIANAVTAAMYQQDGEEPDPFLIGLYLLRSLAQNHCFLDGNKRIAWLAFIEVLGCHGRMTVNVPQKIAASLVELAATGAVDVGTLSHILLPLLVEIRLEG